MKEYEYSGSKRGSHGLRELRGEVRLKIVLAGLAPPEDCDGSRLLGLSSFERVRGFEVRLQVETLPDPASYRALASLILKGADGLVVAMRSSSPSLELLRSSSIPLAECAADATPREIEEVIRALADSILEKFTRPAPIDASPASRGIARKRRRSAFSRRYRRRRRY